MNVLIKSSLFLRESDLEACLLRASPIDIGIGTTIVKKENQLYVKGENSTIVLPKSLLRILLDHELRLDKLEKSNQSHVKKLMRQMNVGPQSKRILRDWYARVRQPLFKKIKPVKVK